MGVLIQVENEVHPQWNNPKAKMVRSIERAKYQIGNIIIQEIAEHGQITDNVMAQIKSGTQNSILPMIAKLEQQP